MVADLCWMFEGREVSEQGGLLATIQGLPLVYTSRDDPLCKDVLGTLKRGDPAAAKFWLHNLFVINRWQPKLNGTWLRRAYAQC